MLSGGNPIYLLNLIHAHPSLVPVVGGVSRLIILEFPDMDALRQWYGSDDYQVLLKLRQSAARTNLVAVEGI